MFHIVLAIASRFLYFQNVLQGFARGILALRNLGVISSLLIPALPPPPPIALLDAPIPFVGLPEEIIPPYPSGGLIALERIERQPPPFVSHIPSYQSSLITVSSSQLPIFLPIFIIMLAIISGFILLLPEITTFFMNVAKSRNIPTFKPFSHLLPAGPMLLRAIEPIVTILQWCGLLAMQDTRTPPLLNAIYEQITRGAAGYNDLVDGNDMSFNYVEDQAIADGSIRYPDLVHDEIPEEYRLRLQYIYTQFVDSQNCLREQLELSRAHQQELHADLLAAEHERERLISTLGESDKKRQGAKARCAEAEVTVSKLRADLTAAMDHLDRQTEAASSKDHIIQSVTEKSQVAHVRLKYAEDKITHLNAKLQRERDRRLRKTKELLDEQVKVQDRHESEIHRIKQEAQVAQEQLDTLRDEMSQLHADRRSPLDHDHSACYQQPTTRPCDTCQPPLPPEPIYDISTPPISPAINVDSTIFSLKSSSYSPTRDQKDPSTPQDPTPEVAQEHRAALEKLFERMRQGEYENAQDAVQPEPNSEQQESRLQGELAVTKEQLCMAEEEVLTMRRDLDQSREAFRELKTHVVFLRSEWETCKAILREAQDARRSNMAKLAEIIELLRVSRAESEDSRFRCSQVTFLCSALQERVTELEAKVKKLKNPAVKPIHTDSESQFCCPTSMGTGIAPPDVEAITHELKFQDSDSIYLTISPSLPRILDFSLPILSSPFASPSSLGQQKRPVGSPTRTDIHSRSFCPADTDVHSIIRNSDSYLRDLSLALQSFKFNISYRHEDGLRSGQDAQQSIELVRSTGCANPEVTNLGHHLVPLSSPSLEGVSCLPPPLYRTFLSERNSLGSMDWPPIESVLFPGRGNVRQGREGDIGFQTEEEGTDDPILCDQDALSRLQEPEPVLDRGLAAPDPTQISSRSSITPSSPPILNFSHREEVTSSLRQDRCTSSVTKASPTFSSHRDVPIRSPHHSLPPLSKIPRSPFLGLLDPVTIDSVPDGTVQQRKARRYPGQRRRFSHKQGIPVPKLDYDLPADFVPSSFGCTTPNQQAIGIDDFAYLIPLDCRTSTPAAARKRNLKKGLPDSGRSGTDLAGINSSPSPPKISSPRRKRMPLGTIDNSPRPRVRPNLHPWERKSVKGKERMPVQAGVLSPDPTVLPSQGQVA